MENTKQYYGAKLDDRPAEAKLKDYKIEEIVSTFNPVNWVEKARSQWRKFPIFNQDGSGSCVAQTAAKLLGIIYWLKNNVYVHFSATDIYQRRWNKPEPGMNGSDVLEIMKKGVTLEDLVPSQNMSDKQMDQTEIPQYKRDVGSIFKIGNYVYLPTSDIDAVASVIETTKKGVMLWFFFEYDEWTDVPTIKHQNLNLVSAGCRHSVTGVDNTLYGGKKAIIIEDSWGPQYGLEGQRVITEDFFKARNFFAAYPLSFVFDKQDEKPEDKKPRYKFTKTMAFSATVKYDKDVIALQNILKYEGLFPTNVESTGYYGAITAKAVLAFQRKYKVASDAELNSLQGKSCGPKTINKLNELFGI